MNKTIYIKQKKKQTINRSLPLQDEVSLWSTVMVKYNGLHFSKVLSLQGSCTTQEISSFALVAFLQDS